MRSENEDQPMRHNQFLRGTKNNPFPIAISTMGTLPASYSFLQDLLTLPLRLRAAIYVDHRAAEHGRQVGEAVERGAWAWRLHQRSYWRAPWRGERMSDRRVCCESGSRQLARRKRLTQAARCFITCSTSVPSSACQWPRGVDDDHVLGLFGSARDRARAVIRGGMRELPTGTAPGATGRHPLPVVRSATAAPASAVSRCGERCGRETGSCSPARVPPPCPRPAGSCPPSSAPPTARLGRATPPQAHSTNISHQDLLRAPAPSSPPVSASGSSPISCPSVPTPDQRCCRRSSGCTVCATARWPFG